MKGKLEFLTSTRFWAIVVAAFSIYAKAKGIIGEDEMLLISTIMGGFITVRTIDRVSEQKVIAAKESSGNTTVTIPQNVSQVTASTKEV